MTLLVDGCDGWMILIGLTCAHTHPTPSGGHPWPDHQFPGPGHRGEAQRHLPARDCAPGGVDRAVHGGVPVPQVWLQCACLTARHMPHASLRHATTLTQARHAACAGHHYRWVVGQPSCDPVPERGEDVHVRTVRGSQAGRCGGGAEWPRGAGGGRGAQSHPTALLRQAVVRTLDVCYSCI